jgi:hypothetical protein
MTYDPNQPHHSANKRRKLAEVTTGILLSALGVIELSTQRAEAINHGAELTQIDLESTKESPLKPIDTRLESLLAEMRSLAKHHQKGIYVQHFNDHGKAETRITASEKLIDPQTGQVAYNHFSLMARPEDRLPQVCALLSGVDHPEFEPGETYQNSATMARANNPMEQYYFEVLSKDPNSGQTLEYHFLLTDRHSSAKDFPQKTGILSAFIREGKRMADQVQKHPSAA